MYRSGSSSRVSDELFAHPSSTAATAGGAEAVQSQQLPTYNPESHVAKKEKNRLRSSEIAVHMIPLLLVVCAAILWFFSTPVAVDMTNRGDHVVIRTTS